MATYRLTVLSTVNVSSVGDTLNKLNGGIYAYATDTNLFNY